MFILLKRPQAQKQIQRQKPQLILLQVIKQQLEQVQVHLNYLHSVIGRVLFAIG